jgi:hypothetical protein
VKDIEQFIESLKAVKDDFESAEFSSVWLRRVCNSFSVDYTLLRPWEIPEFVQNNSLEYAKTFPSEIAIKISMEILTYYLFYDVFEGKYSFAGFRNGYIDFGPIMIAVFENFCQAANNEERKTV